MTYRLSVVRILKRDWASFGLTITAAGFLLFALGCEAAALRAPERGDVKDYRNAARFFVAVGALPLAAVAAWRVYTIRRVFAQGERVEAEVYQIGENSEDIGYAMAKYPFLGREYTTKIVTERVSGRVALAPGDGVELMVDPNRPSRAYLLRGFTE